MAENRTKIHVLMIMFIMLMPHVLGMLRRSSSVYRFVNSHEDPSSPYDNKECSEENYCNTKNGILTKRECVVFCLLKSHIKIPET